MWKTWSCDCNEGDCWDKGEGILILLKKFSKPSPGMCIFSFTGPRMFSPNFFHHPAQDIHHPELISIVMVIYETSKFQQKPKVALFQKGEGDVCLQMPSVAQVANVQMCFYDLYALPVAVFLLCRHGSLTAKASYLFSIQDAMFTHAGKVP